MKYLFYLIHILLIGIAAFFCVDIYGKLFMPGADLPSGSTGERLQAGDQTLNASGAGFSPAIKDAIAARNLFKVGLERKTGESSAGSKALEKIEPTTLSLSLWGTVTGGPEVYAVIEDKKTRLQALYQVGDSVQGAGIKKIQPQEVILTFQGKDQILNMETQVPGPAARPLLNPAIPELPVVAPSVQAVFPRAGSPADLGNRIKVRPYFSKGVPDGVMVYGIRPDSVFGRGGLRNGDIVRSVNGTPVTSVEEAVSQLAGMENSGSAKLTLTRSGETKAVDFNAGSPAGAANPATPETVSSPDPATAPPAPAPAEEAKESKEERPPPTSDEDETETSEDINKGEDQ